MFEEIKIKILYLLTFLIQIKIKCIKSLHELAAIKRLSIRLEANSNKQSFNTKYLTIYI